eukprot:2267075-Prymnesium_polylepis.1
MCIRDRLLTACASCGDTVDRGRRRRAMSLPARGWELLELLQDVGQGVGLASQRLPSAKVLCRARGARESAPTPV